MGTVYRKTFTKPLPAGAEIIVRKGQRLAEWKDAKGKTRTAPVTTGKDGKTGSLSRLARSPRSTATARTTLWK